MNDCNGDWKRGRRAILHSMAAASCWLALPHAMAQQDPGRPLRFLVPFTPGGGSDLVARAMQMQLQEILRQPVVIENKPGGGTTLGTNIVAKAPPDGHLIQIVTIAHAVNPSLYAELPYDSVKDFTPLSLATAAPMVLVVNKSVPANTVAELIALAKSQPGKLNYASPGNGSPTHLSAELLKSMTGMDVMHIAYKGAGPATTDLLGGQVQMTFSSIGVVMPLIKSGQVKALGVTTAKRASTLPDVPAIGETVPNYSLTSWQAILAPGGMKPEVAARLNKAIVETLNAPAVRKSLEASGYESTPTSLEETSRFIRDEMQRYARIVKTVGVRPE